MKKMLLRSGLSLFAALVLLQLWRPPRNDSSAPSPQDIAAGRAVPAKVLTLLHNACYDCHSNHPKYPWYASVQPVRWWLDSHINDGKRHLNFSEFGGYSATRAGKKLEQISDEVDQHDMPLKSYTWMHPEARLTPEEVRLITDWADALRDQIAPP
jgi:hypothetical protein